ncbi:MAG: fatty acid desaturase [Methyloversatilis discipulorum]|uniref:DesA family fatty acid desaturase n=1 Tax=Methyloversatilis discipulorum TaxID=1119528 RepID=UPI0026EC9711|nr:fatty acid desaturase [Methyloversatilis discipulorum]MBV5286188.1 fatty acid desaturase [Methyloversatilis discipulorum]
MLNGLIDLPWWGYIVVALVFTHITIASVTIFLHRHQAHRALELHAIPSHFFRFWLWLTTGMVTKEWAAIHRKHHAKCETPEDPHSPQVLGIKKVLFEGAELYRAEAKNKETMSRYGHGTPDDWLERNLYTGRSALGIKLMLVINVLLFGPLGLTIWAVQMAWIPIWAAGVVNGLGHYIGYRNYDCNDAATNLVPWGIIIGGEELHNNHHSFATSAKLSSKWYEFDIGWMYIRILEILGLAKAKKTIPQPRFETRNVVDTQTLEAIITHRYDVMTRYMKSLRSIYAEEVEKLRASNAALADGERYQRFKRWLNRSENAQPTSDDAEMASMLSHSSRLETVHTMRQELTALWARSTASSEQLLKQLQDWCARAEASGIKQLQDFSMRLKSYAI